MMWLLCLPVLVWFGYYVWDAFAHPLGDATPRVRSVVDGEDPTRPM